MSDVNHVNGDRRLSDGAWLRGRVQQQGAPEPLVLPGAYDAVTARLVQAAGADGIYVGGFAAIASSFGVPDVGLVAGGELIDTYRRIRGATDLPMVVDIDTGYGNVANVRRTVQAVVDVGVAGFHIEDQANPKRCGHLEHEPVSPVRESVARVAAAVSTAAEAGAEAPVVIARTDSLHTEGLAAAIERVQLYREAGADVTFVDAIPSVDAMKRIRDEVEGPLLFNAASTGRSPQLSLEQLGDLGFAVVIYPIELLLSALAASRSALNRLGDGLDTSDWYGFADLTSLLGLPAIEAWVSKFPTATDDD